VSLPQAGGVPSEAFREGNRELAWLALLCLLKQQKLTTRKCARLLARPHNTCSCPLLGSERYLGNLVFVGLEIAYAAGPTDSSHLEQGLCQRR
jgi:hypothetical protein